MNPRLDFDEYSHQYSVSGAPYDSVTQILTKLKLTPPYPEDRGQKDFGTACHKATELAAWSRLDFSTTSPLIIPYVNGFLTKKQEMNIRPILTEARLYDPSDGYAGTLDLFAWVFENELAIVDYKSGAPPNCVELQLAGYERLLRRSIVEGRVTVPDSVGMALAKGIPIRRYSMKLTPDRAIMKEYKDGYDTHAWEAAVNLHKWVAHRRKDIAA